jgi:hypothetical protein
MSDTIINKVSESSLVTLNLEDYFPETEILAFDLKDYLFMGLILKEKPFREALANLDLSPYKGKVAAVACSADAIIPQWAYMLVASILQPVCADVFFGNTDSVRQQILLKNIASMPASEYDGKRVVIKGCGEKPVGEAAYLLATKILRPIAKSIMYGEPCSTVPVYKQPKTTP